ncbi:hypothetical protein [Streptomyces sp. NPDC008092]|uniref:hypothetical protein n=1 Tax=Streptomyces sp. NPDC008092 TaxID=3364808 RepID=UPI0036E35372
MTTDQNRALAAQGAARLRKDGLHDEAAAIEGFLAPGGWVLLRDSDTRDLSPLSLMMTTELKADLRAASAEFAIPLPALAEEGYRAVLETGWRPPRTMSVRPGGKRTTLQVSVDSGLRRQVQEVLPGMTREAGHRVTESSIAIAWMCSELGVDLGTASTLTVVLPRPLRDHFVAAAGAAGVDLDEVVNQRLRELVDGSWELPRPSRAAKGSLAGVEPGKLTVRIREELALALVELAPVLSERLSFRLYPGMIVRWILIDRLGQPAV